VNPKANESFIRMFLGGVLPFGLVLLALLPFLLFHGRVPEPIATHWGISGRPNGSMPLFVLVIINLVLAGVPAVGMVRSVRRKPAYKGSLSPLMPILTFISTLAAWLSWSVMYTNLDVSDWTRARMAGGVLPGLLTGMAVPVLMACLAWRLAKLIELPDQPMPALPSAHIKPGDRAVWIGTARSLWGLPLLIGLMGFGIYKMTTQNYPGGLIALIVALVGLPFMSVRVLVDSRGVQLSFGPLGWPKKVIPLGKIRQARGIDVMPMAYGGYGYRGSMKLRGRVAIVLRGGEGLELGLEGNKRLIITVDGAEEGAGLINDLIARS
jgi:hypothetical protein